MVKQMVNSNLITVWSSTNSVLKCSVAFLIQFYWGKVYYVIPSTPHCCILTAISRQFATLWNADRVRDRTYLILCLFDWQLKPVNHLAVHPGHHCSVQLHWVDFGLLSNTPVINGSGRSLILSQVGVVLWKNPSQNVLLSILLSQWKNPRTYWLIHDLYEQLVVFSPHPLKVYHHS